MTAAPRRYRVRTSRATVCDALSVFFDLDFRADIADAILGRIPCGTEFDGRPVSIALSPDLTAHGIEITWPLDTPPTQPPPPAPPSGGGGSGATGGCVIGYVLPSSVDEVAP